MLGIMSFQLCENSKWKYITPWEIFSHPVKNPNSPILRMTNLPNILSFCVEEKNSLEIQFWKIIPQKDLTPLDQTARLNVQSSHIFSSVGLFCKTTLKEKGWFVGFTSALYLFLGALYKKRCTSRLRDVERNDKGASKRVAKHFNLPNHSKQYMSVCGLSLHRGSSESRKTLEQKFIFQIGTLYPHGINEHFSFN